ncbi:hypothetical protein ACIO3O_37675 [Streptomyces sp. NPDC087440]|uniref:hypothetical protein n=1 Tax=Streptomyces sp. NPDC087440 TaxID=3365790 RepID=UPI00380478C9
MGWATDDGLHEGYAVAVLADGRDATAEDNLRGNSAWRCFDGTDGKPLAVGVRAACDCYDGRGRIVKEWRGATVFPVFFEDEETTEGPGEDGDSPYAEWQRTHAAPAAATTVPADVTELLGQVRERLRELAAIRPLAALSAVARLEGIATAAARSAARAAQEDDRSWADIGTALGVSKQAAHQRLARHVQADGAAAELPPVLALDEAAHLAAARCTPQEELLTRQRTPFPLGPAKGPEVTS